MLLICPIDAYECRELRFLLNDLSTDVEREADLLDIEPQRSLDIAHRQRDHFD